MAQNTKINILDQIDVNTPDTPINQNIINNVEASGEIAQSSNSETSSNPLDFINKYLTKKNIYILCGIIIIAGLIYYFYLKNNEKKKTSKNKNEDVNITIPSDNSQTNHFIELPENNHSQMTQEEYNRLIQQQLLQQQQQQQQQQPDLQQPNQEVSNSLPVEQPTIVHPGQDLQDQKLEVNDSDEIESPVLDNQNLTADEIKQISEQLQKLQAEGSN